MKTKKFKTTNTVYQDSLFEDLHPFTESKRVILKTGQVIYNKEETEEYNFLDFYEDYCKDTYFGELKEPYMMYTGTGAFGPLENLEYDQETINYLNSVGLKIFLQEIIIVYFDNENPKTLESMPLNFVYDGKNDKMFCDEFESIKIFIKKNKLTNVSVYTCESNTRKILQNTYPEFKIFSANSWATSYNYHRIENIFKEIYDCESIEKKFISLSLRYEVNKHLISMYLLEKENKLITWHENYREWAQSSLQPLDYLKSHLPFDLQKWKVTHPVYYRIFEKNSLILHANAPILLDCEKEILNDHGRLRCGTEIPPPVDAFKKSFCHIICETKFGQPFGYFSEKVFHPMAFMRPFILVSTPHSLEYLKMHNFMTFDRWWDESYDAEEDHEQRIIKIFQLIDYIDSLSIDKMKSLWQEMYPVLLHNQKQIFEIRKQLRIF